MLHWSKRKYKQAQRLMDFLFSNPHLDTGQIKDYLGLSSKATNELIQDLIGHGILVEATGAKRNRLFKFQAYLDLFE